ncbi:hypothetical protein JTB14_000433 [Gonioctena quinquepunctata]|nr:hypothetical protein JTB14_000433 [Gonioctena quinquepunctata]
MNLNIESGVQLFSRLNSRTTLEGINPIFFPCGGPHPNQVVEITGHPKIDKNDLLMDFLVKCILPSKYCNEWKGSGAVFINTDFQINLFKIIKVIETYLNQQKIKDSRKEIIENALKNLTIYECFSPEELEITFMSLEKFIFANENVSLVVIDNIAAHYWIAKLNSNMLSYFQHSLRTFDKVYNALKSLNILFIFVRNDKQCIKKRSSANIDYRIEIQEGVSEGYQAVITNFEKETTVTVSIKIDIILKY